MTRYVLHPGWVTSKNDGDRHYITSLKLIDLYGVHPACCRVHRPDVEDKEGEAHLWPRYDGNYSLPS